MEFTTENNNVTPSVTPQAPAPQPAPKAIEDAFALQPSVTAAPVHTPIQVQAMPAPQPAQSIPVQPVPAPQTAQPATAQTVTAQPVPQPTAPAVASATPVVQSAPQPAMQPSTQPQAVQSAPAPVQAPQTTNAQPEANAPQQEESENEGGEEKKTEKKPPKLILNTQRIIDDWKNEKGKVLIFLMKLLKVLVILFSISLFTMGFTSLLAANIAISFFEPVRFLERYANHAPFILIGATFLTIWAGFANKLTPYFKAFSIAKWLKNNKVDPKEVMKIYLQSRREKQLTKYKKGRGAIKAEKADLSQAAFILLNEEHKKSYKTEMVWALLFWLFISALKVAFVYFLSLVVSNICLQIKEIIEQAATFDFMKLVGFALDPIFLIVIGSWIVVGITGAIVLASIAHARNKKQQKWVKTYMRADMPSKEYYEE